MTDMDRSLKKLFTEQFMRDVYRTWCEYNLIKGYI